MGIRRIGSYMKFKNLNLKYAKKAASSYRAFTEKEHNALLDAVKKLTGKNILL